MMKAGEGLEGGLSQDVSIPEGGGGLFWSGVGGCIHGKEVRVKWPWAPSFPSSLSVSCDMDKAGHFSDPHLGIIAFLL
jgi:hypothetical protein